MRNVSRARFYIKLFLVVLAVCTVLWLLGVLPEPLPPRVIQF